MPGLCRDCLADAMDGERCPACGGEVRVHEVGQGVEDADLKRLLSSVKLVERVGGSPGKPKPPDTGLTIARASNPGFSFIDLIACARPRSTPTTIPQATRRPCSEKCGS